MSLAPVENDADPGETVIITGWGRTSDTNTSLSDELRKASTTVITNLVCADTYGQTVIDSGLICISTVAGQGTCLVSNYQLYIHSSRIMHSLYIN